jgi:predicted Zn-dependent protease
MRTPERRQEPGRERRGRAWAVFLLGVAALLALACSGGGGGPPGGGGPAGGGEGPGHREQPLALNPAKELQLGEEAFQEVREKYRGNILPPDASETVRVERVATKILEAARIEPLEREINLHVSWKYIQPKFLVVRSREVNAFCLPGCKVVVFTGLLRVAGDNDAFLATVLSHEIAHALAHHTSERMAREPTGRKTLGGLKFERWQESEADHIGLFLMTFAGYNPEEAVRFWQRMTEMSGGSGLPEILSDHPSDTTRIRQIQGWAQAAAGAYRAYRQGRVVRDRAA